jgi:hypothetical protein
VIRPDSPNRSGLLPMTNYPRVIDRPIESSEREAGSLLAMKSPIFLRFNQSVILLWPATQRHHSADIRKRLRDRVPKFQNNVGVTATGTSRAHSWSSFSGRFTRVLTGYFLMSLASNGLAVRHKRRICDARIEPQISVFRSQDHWHSIMHIGHERIGLGSEDGAGFQKFAIRILPALSQPSKGGPMHSPSPRLSAARERGQEGQRSYIRVNAFKCSPISVVSADGR